MTPIPTHKTTVIDHAAAGRRVRQLRRAAGVSLRSLASRMGMAPSMLSDLEHGRRNWNSRLWLDAMRLIPAMQQEAEMHRHYVGVGH